MIDLPLWFLVGSLFLPRICLFFAWYGDPPFNQMDWGQLVAQPWSALLWLALPRVLVLMVIHANIGFGLWFWLHLVTAILVWIGCIAAKSN